jgi:hypothetical protein
LLTIIFAAIPHGKGACKLLGLLYLGFFLGQAHAGNSQDKDIEVDVNVNDGTVFIDTKFRVTATQQEVWAVLTDFDHMSGFMSNLELCKVLGRSGDILLVEQKGKAVHGFLTFAFDIVREVQLTPIEKIQSHVLSGNLKKFDGVTQLSADATGTLIVSHGETIPDMWIPPIIGPSMIESEVHEQLEEFRKEIMRRKQLVAPQADSCGEGNCHSAK